MDISVFCDLLHSEMVKMGVPEDKTLRYIQSLRRNLDPNDLVGVTEMDVPKYAKVCADQVLKTAPKKDTVPDGSSPDFSDDTVAADDPAPAEDTAKETPADETEPEISDPAEDDYSIPEKTPEAEEPRKKSARGTGMLFLITAITSPLWILAALLFFTPFILMFASEAALTAVLICLLAGCTALGTAASLTGIVYGIVKMFDIPAVGLYEIGFGIIIAGVSMICGILIYNGAVRFMPWLFKRSGKLLPLAMSKIKPVLTKYRRWCEKL